MQRALSTIVKLLACGALTLGSAALAADAAKVDANGKWAWTQAGRGGGEPQKYSVMLKAEGEKVTGKLSAPGRGGGAATETDITEGKLKGDEISFQLVREFNGNKVVIKYTGKISGDTIKGKREREGAEPQDWEAKREKPAAK